VLERGVASGDFRPLDLEVTPALLLGMIRGGLINAPGVARERLAEAAIDLVLHGGLPPPAEVDRAPPPSTLDHGIEP
jgi:hypothetical protein